jgi:hypothetical protein
MDFNTFKEKAKKYRVYKLILNEYIYQNLCLKNVLNSPYGNSIHNIIMELIWYRTIKGEWFWCRKYNFIRNKELYDTI